MRLVLVLAVVLALAPAAHAQTIGINAAGLQTAPASTRDAHLQLLHDAGVRLVRTDATWTAPAPDEWVAALAAHGLRWAPIIDYNRGPDPFTAPDPAAFADYTATLVSRYGHGGSFWTERPGLPYMPVETWEVWNEENSEQFWHPVDARAYGRLYARTRAAIRSVDPSAKAMVGGLLGPGSARFLRATGIRRPDIVGVHPYSATVPGVRASIAAVRRVTRAPIAVTEVGWTGVSGAWWTRLLRRLPTWRLGVVQVIPYAWLEPQWGLATESGPTEAGRAFLSAARCR